MLAIKVQKIRLALTLTGAIVAGVTVAKMLPPVQLALPLSAPIAAPYVAPIAIPLPPPRPKNLGVRTKIKSSGILPAQLAPVFASSAKQVSLSPALVAAVAYQESRFDSGVCSAAGACGIMQMMPATAKDYKVTRHNAQSSIRGGAQMLADLHKRYAGNTGLALAAYNWGPGNVNKWLAKGALADKMPKETRDYVRQITGKGIDVWTGKTRTLAQLLGNLEITDHLQKMTEIFKR